MAHSSFNRLESIADAFDVTNGSVMVTSPMFCETLGLSVCIEKENFFAENLMILSRKEVEIISTKRKEVVNYFSFAK